MHMRVLVVLGDVQPYAKTHQAGSQPEGYGDGLPIQHDRDRRPDERCSGEIGAGARRTKVAKRHDEQDETHTIACKSERQRTGEIGQGRKLRAEPNSQYRVRGSGDQAFDRRNHM